MKYRNRGGYIYIFKVKQTHRCRDQASGYQCKEEMWVGQDRGVGIKRDKRCIE